MWEKRTNKWFNKLMNKNKAEESKEGVKNLLILQVRQLDNWRNKWFAQGSIKGSNSSEREPQPRWCLCPRLPVIPRWVGALSMVMDQGMLQVTLCGVLRCTVRGVLWRRVTFKFMLSYLLLPKPILRGHPTFTCDLQGLQERPLHWPCQLYRTLAAGSTFPSLDCVWWRVLWILPPSLLSDRLRPLQRHQRRRGNDPHKNNPGFSPEPLSDWEINIFSYQYSEPGTGERNTPKLPLAVLHGPLCTFYLPSLLLLVASGHVLASVGTKCYL